MNKTDLIANLNADLAREYGHWHFYANAAIRVAGLHREELTEFFEKSAADEQAHVLEWGKLIVGLGGVPTREVAAVESDTCCPAQLLLQALAMEEQVVANFVERLDQAEELQANGGQDKIDGKWVELFLEDQVTDSRADADHLREMVKGLGEDAKCPAKK